MLVDNRITPTFARNRFVRPLFHPDPPAPEPPKPDPEPTPEPPKPDRDLDSWRHEAIRRAEAEEKLKAERDELAAFKAEQERLAEEKRQADLEAKGEYEKLLAEQKERADALAAENEAFKAAEAERRTAATEAVEAFLKDRTDADTLRGKAIRLVGDDPYKQMELLRELTATTAPGAPPTSAPSRDGGESEPGDGDLDAADIAKLEARGENTPEGRKRLATFKRRFAANQQAIDLQVQLQGQANAGVK